jgi:hypothetical protein
MWDLIFVEVQFDVVVTKKAWRSVHSQGTWTKLCFTICIQTFANSIKISYFQEKRYCYRFGVDLFSNFFGLIVCWCFQWNDV